MNIFYVPLCLWDQGCSSDTFSFQFLTGCPVHLDIPIFTERFVEPEYQVPVLQVPGTAALALVAESITDGKCDLPVPGGLVMLCICDIMQSLYAHDFQADA